MEESELLYTPVIPQPPIDEAMLGVREFIAQMTDVDAYLISEADGFALKAESVELDMPLQLDVHVDDAGKVTLGGSPPLYYVETTIMPVFHQIQVSIEIDHKP